MAQQVVPCKYDAALQMFGDSAANAGTNLELGHGQFQNWPTAAKIGGSPISVRSVTAKRSYSSAGGVRMAARRLDDGDLVMLEPLAEGFRSRNNEMSRRSKIATVQAVSAMASADRSLPSNNNENSPKISPG